MKPMAYFLTIGTYGTRLHGDPRGSVDSAHNTPGDPFLPSNSERQCFERALMDANATLLTAQQLQFIEHHTPTIVEKLGWSHHVISAARNHVHAIVSAEPLGSVVRRLLKRKLSQALSGEWSSRAADLWWAEGGSVKWLWDDGALRLATQYVSDQRTEERHRS